jgi:hypothetical protein
VRDASVKEGGLDADEVTPSAAPCYGGPARGGNLMPDGQTNRRAFIAGLGGAVAWPVVARAREMPRIAVLFNFTEKSGQPLLAALLQALRPLGWVDGETAHIDIRWGAGDAERIRKGIAELLALAPDIIVTNGTRPHPCFAKRPERYQSCLGQLSIQLDRESLRACRSPVET